MLIKLIAVFLGMVCSVVSATIFIADSFNLLPWPIHSPGTAFVLLIAAVGSVLSGTYYFKKELGE